MQIGEFISAIKQLSGEKNLPEEVVVEAVEAAIAAAYRKDYGKQGQTIKVKLDPQANKMNVWRVLSVVEESQDEKIVNPESQIPLDKAVKMKKGAKAGDTIETPLEVKSDFGRVAAQTAKQVIIQRLREAEREVLYREFKEKEKRVINATVQRIEGTNVIFDLGKVNGIMVRSDQIPAERYYTGQRLKVFVSDVEETNRGPRILVSRTSSDFILGLFAQEVPEIESGAVEIAGIAREAGSRTKIAVRSNDETLDPVGSVVGQRGTRVQAVLSEIQNEKIDIILYSKNPEVFITNSLSPARVDKMKLDKKEGRAKIWVDEDQLSLAIGKTGQNVRLAGKLTGWTIDIVKDREAEEKKTARKETVREKAKKTEKGKEKKKGIKTKPEKPRSKKGKTARKTK